jgi:hypothetical protein
MLADVPPKKTQGAPQANVMPLRVLFAFSLCLEPSSHAELCALFIALFAYRYICSSLVAHSLSDQSGTLATIPRNSPSRPPRRSIVGIETSSKMKAGSGYEESQRRSSLSMIL